MSTKCLYAERLRIVGLYSHKKRRLRQYLIEVNKILTGKEKVNLSEFLVGIYNVSGKKEATVF